MAERQSHLLQICIIVFIVQGFCSAAPQGVSDQNSELTNETTPTPDVEIRHNNGTIESEKNDQLTDEFVQHEESDNTAETKTKDSPILSIMAVLNKFSTSLIDRMTGNETKSTRTDDMETSTKVYRREIIDSEIEKNDFKPPNDDDHITSETHNEQATGNQQTAEEKIHLSQRVGDQPIGVAADNISEIKITETQGDQNNPTNSGNTDMSPRMNVEDETANTKSEPITTVNSEMTSQDEKNRQNEEISAMSPRFLTEEEHALLISKSDDSRLTHASDNVGTEGTTDLSPDKQLNNVQVTSRITEENPSDSAMPPGMSGAVTKDIGRHKEIISSLKENTDDLVAQLRATNLQKEDLKDHDSINQEEKDLSPPQEMKVSETDLSHSSDKLELAVNKSKNDEVNSTNVPTSDITSGLQDTNVTSRILEGHSAPSDTDYKMYVEISSEINEDITGHKESIEDDLKNNNTLVELSNSTDEKTSEIISPGMKLNETEVGEKNVTLRFTEGHSPKSDTDSYMTPGRSSANEDITKHKEMIISLKENTDDLVAQMRTINDEKSELENSNMPPGSFSANEDITKHKEMIISLKENTDDLVAQMRTINDEKSELENSNMPPGSFSANEDITKHKEMIISLKENTDDLVAQMRTINDEKSELENSNMPPGSFSANKDITKHKEMIISLKENTDDLVAQMRTINDGKSEQEKSNTSGDTDVKIIHALPGFNKSTDDQTTELTPGAQLTENSQDNAQVSSRITGLSPKSDMDSNMPPGSFSANEDITKHKEMIISLKENTDDLVAQMRTINDEKSELENSNMPPGSFSANEDITKHKEMIISLKENTDDLVANLRTINNKISENTTLTENSGVSDIKNDSLHHQTKREFPQNVSEHDQINTNNNKSEETDSKIPELTKSSDERVSEITQGVQLNQTENKNTNLSSRITEEHFAKTDKESIIESDIPKFVQEDIARHKEAIANFKDYNDRVVAQLRTIKDNSTNNEERLDSSKTETPSFSPDDEEIQESLTKGNDSIKVIDDLNKTGSTLSEIGVNKTDGDTHEHTDQPEIPGKLSNEEKHEPVPLATRITEENSDREKIDTTVPSDSPIAEDRMHNDMITNLKESTDTLAAHVRTLSDDEKTKTENEAEKNLNVSKLNTDSEYTSEENLPLIISTHEDSLVSPRIRSDESIPFHTHNNDDINFEILKSSSGDIKPRMQSGSTLKDEENVNKKTEDIKETLSVDQNIPVMLTEESDGRIPGIRIGRDQFGDTSIAHDVKRDVKKLREIENDSGIASSSALLEEILNMEIGSGSESDDITSDESNNNGDRTNERSKSYTKEKQSRENMNTNNEVTLRYLSEEISGDNLNNVKNNYDTAKILNDEIQLPENIVLNQARESTEYSKTISESTVTNLNVLNKEERLDERNENYKQEKPDSINLHTKNENSRAVNVCENVPQGGVKSPDCVFGVRLLQENSDNNDRTETSSNPTDVKLSKVAQSNQQNLSNRDHALKNIGDATTTEITNRQNQEVLEGELGKPKTPTDRIDVIIKYMMEVSGRISNMETNVQQIKEDAALVRNAVVRFLMTSRR